MRIRFACRARNCPVRATLVAEKFDSTGLPVRQIKLCILHCEVVIKCERSLAVLKFQTEAKNREAQPFAFKVCAIETRV
jgi:hypothetical protein